MKINGKISAGLDVKIYHGIADLANNKISKADSEWLIPTFAIEEALNYFCAKEKYEICASIKKFFQLHTKYVISSSREDWFARK